MEFKFGTTIVFKNNLITLKYPESKSAITIREIKLEDIRKITPQIRDMNESKFIQFENRIKQKGDRCFVAWINEIPVHFSWIRMKGIMSISSAGRSYNLPDNSAWIFDCRTAENFRGYGIYPAVLSKLCEILLKEKQTVYIDTSASNTSSVKGITKAGFYKALNIYRAGIISVCYPLRLK